MRFILLTRSSRHSEAGVEASMHSLSATKAYYNELEAAGVLVASEQFYPSSSGLRLSFPEPGCEPILTPGPLDEVGQLIAGYIVIEVDSEDEAMAWALRMPDPNGYGEGTVELRRIHERIPNSRNVIQDVMEDELRSRIGLRVQDRVSHNFTEEEK